MKLCLYLQRRFAPIGHELAVMLRDTYGVREFCGYVETYESMQFLRSQKDIRYTGLLLEEDIVAQYKDEPLDYDYLDRIESAYGIPNLWPYINHDRVIRYNLFTRSYPQDKSRYTREEMLRILQCTARAVERFLDEEKPDAVFFSVVTGIGSYLLYEMAKKKGIARLCLYNQRLEERYALCDDYLNDRWLRRVVEDIHEHKEENAVYLKRAQDYLRAYRQNPTYYLVASKAVDVFARTPTTRVEHFGRLMRPARFVASALWFFKSFYIYFRNPRRHDYTVLKPWHETIDKVKRKLRILWGYGDFYTEVDASEPYAFMPLQSEPEALPMLFAPNYAFEQLWLVKQVARSLPVRFTLYVKEHPVMVGLRPRRYYRELAKIPNVKIVDPARSSLEILASARLIFSTFGTAGMEAAMLKKPAIVFSDILYTMLPGVRRCRSVEDLPALVREALLPAHYDERAAEEFIAAIYKEAVPVDLTHLWSVRRGVMSKEERETLRPLVDLMAKKLQLAA